MQIQAFIPILHSKHNYVARVEHDPSHLCGHNGDPSVNLRCQGSRQTKFVYTQSVPWCSVLRPLSEAGTWTQ